MVGPFAKIQDQINYFFPPETHPYRHLERSIDAGVMPQMAVLDIGCGRTAPNLSKLKGRARRLYGIDLVDFRDTDPDLTLFNENVAELKSFKDNSIDLAYSRSVMEHVEDAEAAYREIFRVLAPGGRYIFLTPNRYDYASIIASIVPNRYHGSIVKNTEGRLEEDTFPTCYNSNSFRRIRQLAAETGFSVIALERMGQYPNYLSFSRPVFWLGSLYEKMLEKTPGLGVLRGWIFCILEKPRLT
jgi:ubiquinone/menaquinone biosynthesis C-methylase UbiE